MTTKKSSILLLSYSFDASPLLCCSIAMLFTLLSIVAVIVEVLEDVPGATRFLEYYHFVFLCPFSQDH